MSTVDEINDAIAEALEIDASEVQASRRLDDYENFDSLALLTLIALLEDIGVKISTDDLDQLNTVDDIHKVANR